MLKSTVIRLIRWLPLSISKEIVRGKPSWAFYLPAQKTKVTIRNYLGDCTLDLDMSSDIERRMLSGTYEPSVQRLIRDFVQPGSCVIDVGANVGAISLALSKQIGNSGKLFSFEPGPELYEKLAKNFASNSQLSNHTLVKKGLGSQKAMLQWQYSTSDPGNASILWVDHDQPTIEVEVVTLDEATQELCIDQVDFIKIDVEGMEYDVILGGIKTITKCLPILLFETSLCDDEQVERTQKVVNLLADLNYTFFRLDKHRRLAETTFPNFTGNTVAMAKN